MTTYPTIRIESLDSSTISDLLKAFPELEQVAVPEPEESSVVEDREASTLVLIITLAPAVIQLATAVINYLAAKEHKGRALMIEKGPTEKPKETLLYDPSGPTVHPFPGHNEKTS